MLVRCAICGYDGHAYEYKIWIRRENEGWPELWICDICYIDKIV